MDVKPISTKADHTAALKEIERLWDAADGTPAAVKREVLSILVADYENKRYPIAKIAPRKILAHAIEDDGRSQAELAELLGSRSYASEVLAGKRNLTVEAIAKISAAWHIPTELLIAFTIANKAKKRRKAPVRKPPSRKLKSEKAA